MKRTTTLFLSICGLGLVAVHAQDPQFSQFYAAPQHLNPALTGDTHQERAVLNHRVQWPGVQPGYHTTMAAYDHRFSKLNAGIGGMVLRDKAGTAGIDHTTVAISYSYEARINYKRSVRFGSRLGYTMRGVDPDQFVFADQMIRDHAPTSVESNVIGRVSYMDIAAGALYHTERFWAGVGLDHINRPDQSLTTTGGANVPMRTSAHAGYRFPLDGSPMLTSRTSITAAMHYKMQGTWDQFDLGGYVEHGAITGGMWYRGLPIVKELRPGYGNEALIVLAGYQVGAGLRIGYSFDITLSKLTMRSGGAHEISLVHEWPRNPKARKPRLIPCPKF